MGTDSVRESENSELSACIAVDDDDDDITNMRVWIQFKIAGIATRSWTFLDLIFPMNESLGQEKNSSKLQFDLLNSISFFSFPNDACIGKINKTKCLASGYTTVLWNWTILLEIIQYQVLYIEKV